MNNNQMREGNSMAERGAGQRSWPLSPYEVNFSFARNNAAGDEANWFGPLTPITPLAPPEVAGRQWDYPAGYNLSTLSRPFEPITFSTLRALADGYDLLRLVIETRKDQAARQTWTIAARDSGAPSAEDAARIATVKNFFARPDGIHGFADWARAGGVFMWPGIALTERRGAARVPVAADVARFWIGRLHGPEAVDSAVLRCLAIAAQKLSEGDEAGAQEALDASGLTRLSSDGAVLMSAISGSLGIGPLDLPWAEGPRLWRAEDIAAHLPLFKDYAPTAGLLARPHVWTQRKTRCSRVLAPSRLWAS
jgi:hypothetical protein